VSFTLVGFFVVRIPLAWWLTTHSVQIGPWTIEPGLMGAWMAMFADIIVRGGFFFARFRYGKWDKIRV